MLNGKAQLSEIKTLKVKTTDTKRQGETLYLSSGLLNKRTNRKDTLNIIFKSEDIKTESTSQS